MNKFKIKYFIDFWVILINFTYRLSILGSVIDLIPIRYNNIRLLLALIIIYIFRFGAKFRLNECLKKSHVLCLLIILLVYEAIQGLLMSKSSGADLLVVVIYDALLLCYLYNIYSENRNSQAYQIISQPFKTYCLYNIIVTLIAAILIMTGVLSPYSNDISSNFNLFATNVSEGVKYYFPGYLSICDPSDYRILGFLGIPNLSGLSHEPQALCFTIFPALFLILCGLTNNSILLTIMYVLLFITLATVPSATAILCIMVTLFIDFIWKSIIKKQKLIIFIVPIGFLLSIYFLGPLISEYSSFLDNKVTDSSSNYSKITLMYVINPHSVIGDGILTDKHGDNMTGKEDVGLISCCLLICFYVCVMFKTFKCICSKKSLTHYIGLASLYFWLHALKYSVFVFSYNYLVYILFMLAFADTFSKINNAEISDKRTKLTKLY